MGLKVNYVTLLGDVIMAFFGQPGAVSQVTGVDSLEIKGALQNQVVFPLKSTQGPGIGFTGLITKNNR